MIRKRGDSQDQGPSESHESDAQAAGLDHWSAPASNNIPDALDDQELEPVGPSWQSDNTDETWVGEIQEVFGDVSMASNQPREEPTAAQLVSEIEAYERSMGAVPNPERQPDKPHGQPTIDDFAGRAKQDNTRLDNPVLSDDLFSIPDSLRGSAGPSADGPQNHPTRNRVPEQHLPPNQQAPQTNQSQPGVDQYGDTVPSDKSWPAPEPTFHAPLEGDDTGDSGAPRRGENDPRVLRALQIERARARDLEARREQARLKAEAYETGEISFEEEAVFEFHDHEQDERPDLAEKLGDRNLIQATLVGVTLFVAAFAAIFYSEFTALVVIGIVALVAVAEVYQSMKVAGLNPAKLLGYVTTLALPTALFFRGTEGFPLVIGLLTVFGMLWYLIGADNEQPTLNLGVTALGVLWVGGMAGFAALLIESSYTAGRQILVATIAVTAISDVMAYFGGKAYGLNKFHPASPNKTWEGTLTGFVAALFAGLVIGIVSDAVDQDLVFRGHFTAAIVFGVTVGVLAPIGDLAQSMIKRDLGIKDMGFILPGHGGVMDRIDGLLFALPGAYYVATLFELL